MYPGLTDTDCRVAEFRLHDLRTEAQRRRCGADGRPGTGAAGQGAVRQRLGLLLVRAGQRLPGRAPNISAGGAIVAADPLGSAR